MVRITWIWHWCKTLIINITFGQGIVSCCLIISLQLNFFWITYIFFIVMYCTKEDECCVHITSNQNQSSFDSEQYFRCNDPCRLHINELSMYSKAIYYSKSIRKGQKYLQLHSPKVRIVRRTLGKMIHILDKPNIITNVRHLMNM